uniref:Uncharacterized protein n=1 Tax=Plectus sambesii TaxID=2011161 RepID=A0A914VWE6_9BILA
MRRALERALEMSQAANQVAGLANATNEAGRATNAGRGDARRRGASTDRGHESTLWMPRSLQRVKLRVALTERGSRRPAAGFAYLPETGAILATKDAYRPLRLNLAERGADSPSA